MSRPRFSIVIPTRDREATLGPTLHTCLNQRFDSFEIIVSDNGTTNATRALIDAIGSPKIQYVRPRRPLAMSDHWEFAVGQAEGEFVTVLGSDDGLLAHALAEIDLIVRQFDIQILRWTPVSYHWPDLPEGEFAKPNELLIPMGQAEWHFPIHRMDSRNMIRRVANFEIPYSDLPMIYSSAVHRGLINQVKAKLGRVFRSESPDVFSGIALAHEAGSFHSIDAPMSISGASAGSTGHALVQLRGDSPIAKEFRDMNRNAALSHHPSVPELPTLSALVADSFLRAQESLFPNDPELRLEPIKMISQILKEIHPKSDEEWERVLQTVRAALSEGGADANVQAWFESGPAIVTRQNFDFAPHHHLRRYGQTYLHLDASDFGVFDVMTASILCEKLLGLQKDGINAHLKSD